MIADLDLVLDHDLAALADWIGRRRDTDPPWRVMTIDDTPDPAYLTRYIRVALRADPDALLLRSCRPLSEETIEIVIQSVLTGHAVLFRDTAPVALAPLRERLGSFGLTCETGAAFLARVPGRELRAELYFLDRDQAPRPPDLEDGWDRYETTLEDLPPDLPLYEGSFGLDWSRPEPQSWLPPGTVEVRPRLPDGRLGAAILGGVLPDSALMPIAHTNGRIHAGRKLQYEDEEGRPLPELGGQRLLIDLPAWLGKLVVGTDGGWRALTAEGRCPVVTFRGR